MKRFLKWLLVALGAVVALVLIAVVALVAVVDPNTYRDEIAALVEQRTGRELVIEGDLELSFFPWLGVEAGGVRLSDAPGFGDEPFLAVEQAGVAVKLLPLILSQEVVMETLVLDGARVRLIRNEQGQANWELLAEQLGGGEPAPESQPEQQPEPQGEGGPLGALALGGIRLTDAAVSFQDRQAGVRYEAAPVNLTMDQLEVGEPVALEADWVVTSTGLPRIDGELNGQLVLNQALTQLAARELALQLQLSGEPVPGGELPLALTGNPVLDLAADTLRWPDLELRLAEVPLRAEVAVDQLQQTPVVQAQLEIPQFNARQLLQRLEIPLETADAEALSEVAAQAGLRWADSRLRVEDLRLQLDETTATGEATVASFAPVAAEFGLEVDAIDVDRYLPPPTEDEEQAAASPAAAAAAGAQVLPLETLRQLDLDGRIHVARLTVKELDAEDVTVEIGAEDGVIRLHPATAKLYQGTYQGDMRLDARGERPQVSLNERLIGVQAGPLLEDLIGTPRVLGSANLALTATTAGQTVEQWLQQLAGKGEFRFVDGAVNGVNVAHLLRVAAARLQGATPPQEDAVRQTDFSELAGSLTIDGGVLRNRDFHANTPLARIQGEGKVNVIEQTVNYLLTVNLVDTLEGQGGEPLEQLRNVPIPLRIAGPITDPKFSVDIEQAIKAKYGAELEAKEQELKAKAEQKLEEERQEVEQKLEDKLQEELGGKLQDLFKRD